ncbi:MAG: ROK family protein, partial [Candidatus Omnitrophica bacterium]|nr:ROK family protein [Candidatus Omnitrophota bacterium]
MKKNIIGVDIGGTKIASGIVSADGGLGKTVILPTLAAKGADVSLNQVMVSIEMLLSGIAAGKKSVRGIGICAPGPLDPGRGVVHNPPNLPGWKDVPLAALVRKRFGIDTKLENDANAAGMAEMVWGAAKGYKNIFYITVSTGIGTGIIIGGKIYHGKNGMAGEGGHVTVNYDDKDAV